MFQLKILFQLKARESTITKVRVDSRVLNRNNPLSCNFKNILVIFKIILYKYLINKLKMLLQIRLNKQELQIGFKFIKFLTLYYQN